MKRSAPLRRTAELRAAGPVRRSPGTKDPVGRTARDIVLSRSCGRCEVCGRDAVHLHHRQLRRAGDHRALALLNLCHTCHGDVHAHPAQSTANGLIVSQYADPADVPVMLRGSWWLLTETGKERVPYSDAPGR